VPTLAANLPTGAIVYAIDPGDSLIKYGATGILNSQYPGTFKVTGQTIAFVPEGNGYRVRLELTFDLKSATAIDSFMRNTLLNSLEVDQYPVATLSLTSNALTQTPDSLQSASFTLDGTYTLHGHQKMVELPITITTGTNSLQLEGSMIFNLSNYDVHVPPVLVQDPISFTANLSAQRSF
jgi:polyisoprenoid-binding protein YceI